MIGYEVLSLYCHVCVLKEGQSRASEITEEQLLRWKELHASDGANNFCGSSKAMEQASAKLMWDRSSSCHNFRYTEVLSAGAEPMGGHGVARAPSWNLIGSQVPPLFSLALNDVNLNKK